MRVNPVEAKVVNAGASGWSASRGSHRQADLPAEGPSQLRAVQVGATSILVE